jgi:hypothetical protein
MRERKMPEFVIKLMLARISTDHAKKIRSVLKTSQARDSVNMGGNPAQPAAVSHPSRLKLQKC